MQQQSYDTRKAAAAPLRAEPRFATSGGAGHIQGVQATSAGLIRSTLQAGGGALAILVLFWLPAEYGIDPTGAGGLLGLTEMGDIKTQLAGEAAAQDAATPAAAAGQGQAAPSGDVARRLERIEAQLQQIAVVIGADVISSAAPATGLTLAEPAAPAVAAPAPQPTATAQPASDAAAGWRDELVFTLAPTEGKEIKLVMAAGEVARFDWRADGAGVNYSQHGDDGAAQEVRFDEGRAAAGQDGSMTAPFAGKHGWFWRNRGDAPVTVTLRVGGAYAEMVEVQ